MSLLKYYLDRGISPVHYLADSLDQHLERRKSLYNMLGVPGILFRNSKVLEIAAGSGQNSLYVASQLPLKYVIVEPNPVAIRQIQETYRNFHRPHTRPNILPITLENFPSKELFDVVICEGWLGSSIYERSLVGALASRVAPGGILVLTALSLSGWLPNLIRYCMIQKLLVDKSKDYKDQVALVLAALSVHLKTMTSMTRNHQDWVMDNMVNPTYLDQGLTMEMILNEVSPKGFKIFGASPNFITEWRWFKQLHGDNILTNENVLKCYEKCSHNFLDYRQTFSERDPKLNQRLNKLSNLLLLELSKSKAPDHLNQLYFSKVTQILKKIAFNIKSLPGDLTVAVNEAVNVLKSSKIKPASIARMTKYKFWFGRETMYFCFENTSQKSSKF